MTLGERLTAARKARGVSLEHLARRTRIPHNALRALEADVFECLPPPIYARGYVRAYALEVGLDPAALVAQFDAERPAAPPAPGEQAPVPTGDRRSDGTGMRAVAFALTAATLLTIATWWERDGAGPADVFPPVEPAAEAAAIAPAEAIVGTTGERDAGHAADGVSVALSAARICWVTAAADGRRVIYRLMQPGEREVVSARERITLRIGDAGAMTLEVNGGTSHVSGADGVVRDLVLSSVEGAPGAAAPASPRSGELER